MPYTYSYTATTLDGFAKAVEIQGQAITSRFNPQVTRKSLLCIYTGIIQVTDISIQGTDPNHSYQIQMDIPVDTKGRRWTNDASRFGWTHFIGAATIVVPAGAEIYPSAITNWSVSCFYAMIPPKGDFGDDEYLKLHWDLFMNGSKVTEQPQSVTVNYQISATGHEIEYLGGAIFKE